MGILLSSVFVASLLGSLHCVGMCGPFALLAGTDPQRKSAAIGPTVFYSVGRLVTYAIIGVLFGSLGLAINRGSSSWTQWQQAATFLAGGLMIVVGLIALGRVCGLRIQLPAAAAPLQKFLHRNFQRTLKLPPIPRAIAIGMLTSLMPCGWLYTFAIAAAGTGGPILGMAVMVAFWAGTVPIMTGLMLGINQISQAVQRKIPMLMAVLVIVIGLFTMAHRAPIAMGAGVEIASDVDDITKQVNEVDHEALPCCNDR